MNAKTLKEILENKFEAESKDGAVQLPSGARVTLLVEFGREVLRVARVRSVQFEGDWVAIVGESDSIYVDGSSKFAIKTEGNVGREEQRPGFH